MQNHVIVTEISIIFFDLFKKKTKMQIAVHAESKVLRFPKLELHLEILLSFK